jgi:pyruvate ferredoxin oxidoreductase alpha subunit
VRVAAREVNAAGGRIGVLAVKLFRPFPEEEVASHLSRAKSVVVMDRSMSLGAPSSPLAEDVRSTLRSAGLKQPVTSVVYGIGGRDVTVADAKKILGIADERGLKGDTSVMYGVKG